MALFSLLFFIFGLIIGSFLNCLIYRLALPNFSLKSLGGLRNRSYCPHCKHQLSWLDLFPVLSFIFLKGRCRYCQKPISVQYPLVEIGTAILFVLVGNYLAIQALTTVSGFMSLTYYFLITSLLIVIFVFDLKHYLVPDELVYTGIAAALVYRLFELWRLGHWELIKNSSLEIRNFTPLFNPLAAAFLAALFFWLIYYFSRGRAMGFGDVKLVFSMGLFLGFPKIIVALFFAFLSGAIIGTGLMMLGRKTMKSELPFAPFLVSGTFFALFWGPAVVDFYLKLLFFSE